MDLETLQRLLTTTQDLGGGATPSSVAPLIMGGGSAAVGGQDLFGVSPQALEVAATQARMGGFGRSPDAQLAKDIEAGRVNPADVLDRPASVPTRLAEVAPNTYGRVRVQEPEIQRKAAGTYNTSAVVPLRPQMQETLNTAKQIADSLMPAAPRSSGGSAFDQAAQAYMDNLPRSSGRDPRAMTPADIQAAIDGTNPAGTARNPGATPAGPTQTTLLPNPYGPGSYDPNDPAAVAAVQEQGVQANKVKQASELINQLVTKPEFKGSQKEIVQGILQSLGVVPSPEAEEFAKARGRAQGKAAGEGAGVGDLQADLNVMADKLGKYEISQTQLSRLNAKEKAYVIARAEEKHPGFDLSNYDARRTMRTQFASRSGFGGNITSLNTVIHHMDKLYDAADRLNNSDNMLWNAVRNKGLEMVGNKDITDFKANMVTVADELATLFKGTAATDAQVKHWQEAIKNSHSKEQIKSNMDNLVGLVAGRLGALESTWKGTMGSSRDVPILDPKSREIIQRRGLAGVINDPVAVKGGQQQGNAPQAAVEFLRANPNMKEQFKAKYGYLPEGM